MLAAAFSFFFFCLSAMETLGLLIFFGFSLPLGMKASSAALAAMTEPYQIPGVMGAPMCSGALSRHAPARPRRPRASTLQKETAPMPIIQLSLLIHAPIERCFDLSRSIDLHVASTHGTDERAVAGVTSGLIGMGEEVTWSARHFGVRQRLTSRITAYDRPNHFRDSMVRGAFKRIDHDHFFTARGDATEMRDVFDFESPLGPLGAIADALVLKRYLRGFLERRNAMIKRAAESDRPVMG